MRGFGEDVADFVFGKERGTTELLLCELVVEVRTGAALAFGFAELAVFTGDEVAAAGPRFLGFWLDDVVCSVVEAVDAGAVGCDAVEARLVDRVLDFFDVGEFFAELAVGSERVESELRVVFGVDGQPFSELKVNDTHFGFGKYDDIRSTKSVRHPVAKIHTLFK